MGGRLPTEAEWEKAARGGLEIPVDPLRGWGPLQENKTPKRIYPWGNQKPAPEHLHFISASNTSDTLLDVGSYPDGGSPYGCLDMVGYVAEWTADRYKKDYYADSPPENPKGPDKGSRRVLRGGSFDNNPRRVRCAGRYGGPPVSHHFKAGFRVVSPGPVMMSSE